MAEEHMAGSTPENVPGNAKKSGKEGERLVDKASSVPSGMRMESDSLGQRAVPEDALYGIHTVRAHENFSLSGRFLADVLLRAMAEVKLACCRTNARLGFLPADIARVVEAACEEIIAGKHREWLRTDALQGGAGTSANMNMNEVIANRAALLMGNPPGKGHVLPLEYVNLHQSTNDVFPTAVKVAVLHELAALEEPVSQLQAALQEKEQQFGNVLKLGRTQLQDAVPMTVGMTFGAWAEAVARDRWRVFKCRERIRQVNLGGTAVGTGLGAPREFIFQATDELRRITGMRLSRAENLVDATQNADAFAEVSGMLKTCAANLLKISTDIRLLSSGPQGGLGELRLQPLQAGSSIMPGKVNPVIPEAVSQAALRVMHNDGLISHAVSLGTLELNQFMPLIADAMLESLALLRSGITMFLEACVQTMVPDATQCKQYVYGNNPLATVLVPALGHTVVGRLLSEAAAQQCSLAEVVAAEFALAVEDVNALLTPQRMQQLGFTDETYALFASGDKQNKGSVLPEE